MGLKQKISRKKRQKMFDTITSMPFMYDECLCKRAYRQLGWWPPATDRAISSIFGTRTKLRAKKRQFEINKSHINTLWDCYHEKKLATAKQQKQNTATLTSSFTEWAKPQSLLVKSQKDRKLLPNQIKIQNTLRTNTTQMR